MISVSLCHRRNQDVVELLHSECGGFAVTGKYSNRWTMMRRRKKKLLQWLSTWCCAVVGPCVKDTGRILRSNFVGNGIVAGGEIRMPKSRAGYLRLCGAAKPGDRMG
ncbi:hypothetical protein VFPPC_17932 [Pochonia chlamydosporia 170]|uniref:Uncharacterized protein n=1 Tax=Pochonia chlamydosporia 170 TaxID=1380566 RepID=A0A219ARP0_METCM|nr:hypothetical protein VFPPC_17932 [Pochonia chlamydosporia 170]OWT42875.1 hypothetical protein VFPPC_17932 [Pochonia chlamydosporia 170]